MFDTSWTFCIYSYCFYLSVYWWKIRVVYIETIIRYRRFRYVCVWPCRTFVYAYIRCRRGRWPKWTNIWTYWLLFKITSSELIIPITYEFDKLEYFLGFLIYRHTQGYRQVDNFFLHFLNLCINKQIFIYLIKFDHFFSISLPYLPFFFHL